MNNVDRVCIDTLIVASMCSFGLRGTCLKLPPYEYVCTPRWTRDCNFIPFHISKDTEDTYLNTVPALGESSCGTHPDIR